MRPQTKLSIILGMDLHHVQPKLVEEFMDMHGFLGLYACSLSNTLFSCGQHTNSFGVTTEEAAELEEEDFPSLPSTSLFHGALQEDCPIATWLGTKNQPCSF